jgi:hypothetical protein
VVTRRRQLVGCLVALVVVASVPGQFPLPGLLAVASLLLVVGGLTLGSDRLAWFGLGAFCMAGVMLVFSAGVYYLPIAIGLLILLALRRQGWSK